MPNSKTLFAELVQQISLEESRAEIESIIYLLLENKLGITRSDVLMAAPVDTTSASFHSIIKRLNQHEPIQYILGEADFYGRSFLVNSSTLIPRPETELLVSLVLREKPKGPRILDVGTGSGCIAITLALHIRGAVVNAIDISEPALAVAEENAKRLNAPVKFFRQDVLTETPAVGPVDIMVSNPPYIREKERQTMKRNVTEYEPHLALFVPDDNPLIFYHHLARLGMEILAPGGKIFAEINEALANELIELFREKGFQNVEIATDLDGKNRVVMARK